MYICIYTNTYTFLRHKRRRHRELSLLLPLPLLLGPSLFLCGPGLRHLLSRRDLHLEPKGHKVLPQLRLDVLHAPRPVKGLKAGPHQLLGPIFGWFSGCHTAAEGLWFDPGRPLFAGRLPLLPCHWDMDLYTDSMPVFEGNLRIFSLKARVKGAMDSMS